MKYLNKTKINKIIILLLVASLFIGSVNATDYSKDADCKLYWSMDEADEVGTDITDPCTGNNGTLTGNADIVADSGKFGDAVAVDGAGDYIESLANLDHSGTGDLTICSWYNLPQVRAGAPYLWSAGVQAADQAFGTFLTNTGASNFNHNFQASGANDWDTGDPVLYGSWQHMCFAFNDSSNNVQFYHNGTRIAQIARASTNVGANNIWSGANSGVGNYLNGSIDELIVLSKLLDGDEIFEIYTVGVAPSTLPTITNPVYTNSSDQSPTVIVECTTDCNMVKMFNDSSLSYDTVPEVNNCTFLAANNWSCTFSEELIPGVRQLYFWGINAIGNNTVANLTIDYLAGGTLSGNVTNSTDGIENAFVMVTPKGAISPIYNMSTNSTGEWVFSVPYGNYTICAYDPFATRRGDCTPGIIPI